MCMCKWNKIPKWQVLIRIDDKMDKTHMIQLVNVGHLTHHCWFLRATAPVTYSQGCGVGVGVGVGRSRLFCSKSESESESTKFTDSGRLRAGSYSRFTNLYTHYCSHLFCVYFCGLAG